MHTSLVLIIRMLIPRSASAPNMLRATPVCVRIPTPSTNSTAMSASPTTRQLGSMARTTFGWRSFNKASASREDANKVATVRD